MKNFLLVSILMIIVCQYSLATVVSSELTGILKKNTKSLSPYLLEIDGGNSIGMQGNCLKEILDGSQVWVKGEIRSKLYDNKNDTSPSAMPMQWHIYMDVVECNVITKPFERQHKDETQSGGRWSGYVIEEDPIIALKAFLPENWAILKVEDNTYPTYRPKGKGKCIFLGDPKKDYAQKKIPYDVEIYIMPADYDDGGIDPTDGKGQSWPPKLIASTHNAKIYLWPYSRMDNWKTMEGDILRALLKIPETPVEVSSTAYILMEIVRETKDSEIKWRLIYALGYLHDKRAASLFIECLKDENPTVRAKATRALSDMRVTQAAGPLIELLKKETDGGVIEQSSLALKLLKVRDAVPVLKQIADHKSRQTRRWILQAIGSLGSYNDIPFLAKRLSASDILEQAAAAEAIENLAGVDFEFPKGGGPYNPEAAIKRAKEWWEKNKAEFSVE
jgi:hypothetical protein